MKKTLLFALLLSLSLPAVADKRGHHGNYHNHGSSHHHSDNQWVGPLILGGVIGGVVGYTLSKPSQPTVIYTEKRIPERYRSEFIYDENCDCYRRVLIED